ncbi:MAG: divalent metal cation transporter, partial [Planctomycetota bacterium]
VLGWGWLFAAMIANLVWAMPQFSLGTAAMQQNLGLELSNEVCTAILFVIAAVVIWFYDAGGWGIKLFEILLKILVAFIVLAFFGVVIALATKGQLNGGAVLAGFIPDFSLLSQPAEGLRPFIEASSNSKYWSGEVVSIQKNTMIAAAATAVGINMTFLLPYSMLRKGWDKTFRGLATFDLSTGLFVPFLLATSCVVIAAASQFHAQADPALWGDAEPTAVTEKLQGGYDKNIGAFIEANPDIEPNEADKQLAAMTIKSDAFALASSLENVTGSKAVAQIIFGLGVVGMAISTIIILMLINGFTFTEALGVKNSGVMHRVGSYLPAFTGAFGFLFLWGAIPEAKFWLAVPTSRIGMILLPVAYLTFFLMMNNKRLMGNNMLQGGKKLVVNIIMVAAILVSGYGCAISLWETNMPIPGMAEGGSLPHTVRPYLMTVVGVFIGLAIVVQMIRLAKPKAPSSA